MIPDENTKLFIENFKRIRDIGFVKSHRFHNTGVGKTLEDLMGVEENNLDEPDFGNIEIKSHRKLVSSYVTLFTKSPTNPKSANTLLRDNYGISNEDNRDIKKLHSSMFSSYFNNTYDKWGFRLRLDDENDRLFIDVKNIKTSILEKINVFYDYSILESILLNKLNIVAFVLTENKKIGGDEFFHFNECSIYYKCDFRKFLDLIRQDKIMFDIRIGSYKSGKNYGKIHDHGSGFRVKKENFSELFDSVIVIE